MVVSTSGTQLSLIGTGAKANGTNFSDPSFTLNKNVPIHRWVPWIAGFSSEFVRSVLDMYACKHCTVLDPFAGVGTTLAEALIQGNDVIGFEINPYAVLACKAKMQARDLSLESLRESARQFLDFYEEALASGYEPKSGAPQGFKTRYEFFSPMVLKKVLIMKDFIDAIIDRPRNDLFKLAFGATLVSYSNYSYEPSLGRRASVGKADVIDFPVGETVFNKIREMEEDILWLNNKVTDKSHSAKIVHDSFFEYQSHLKEGSADLIITSPPYLNNYHYNRNTRPHLYWLGFVKKPSDLRRLEESNFGKYWQTVRDLSEVKLEFPSPNVNLERQLRELAKLHPEKGPYGGRGWANYAASYFNDCRKFALGIKFALKAGGTALIVMGNSILQGIMIPTDRYFGDIAESVGLELRGIEIPRQTRTGNSIIQSDVRVGKAKESQQLYEAIVELRKPLG